MRRLSLRVLDGEFVVWRLPPDAPVPELPPGALSSVTRTADELSVVSEDAGAPAAADAERGWRCLAVAGPLPFDLTGVVASLSAPLAAAHIPIFVVSTFDTDYVLVKAQDLARARAVLEQAGHRVTG